MQRMKWFRSLVLALFLMGLAGSMLPAAAQDDSNMVQRNKDAVIEAFAQYSAGNVEGFAQLTTDPFMMNQGETSLAETSHEDVMGFSGAVAGASFSTFTPV